MNILNDVASYYTGTLYKHGETPRGVDWNGHDSQLLRFKQLCKIINSTNPFSINDLGCGYGALVDYLQQHFSDSSYRGYDVSAAMIDAAQTRYDGIRHVTFIQSHRPDTIADYGIASGIFNVRLNHTDAEWNAYMETTLDMLFETSRLGMAFNCLTSYSDADKMRPDLYYADPCTWFDFCKKRYARNVALLHDYGLYEFTVLVRKDDR